MGKIVYYIASSLDGYIAGQNGDVSSFLYQGKGVEKYQSDLQNFKTVIMGRKTYEFGYSFGLEPGQPAYAGMENFIFSDNLKFDKLSQDVHIKKIEKQEVIKIKEESLTDIYLCGGGKFAGWLLENHLIDQLKIKLNPITLGNGTRLFDINSNNSKWKLVEHEVFEEGMIILTYDLIS